MNHRDSQPIQTIRLSDRDKARLLHSIELTAKHETGNHQRRLRVPWPQHDVTLTLISENGSTIRTQVLARNLSRWGVALVHGRFVYPETRCEVKLPSAHGKDHVCNGTVVHARHIQGLIHELGVRFDSPIDLCDFAVLTPEQETRHLKELADDMPVSAPGEVAQLASRVLVVDDYASDRKLYSHWLNRAGMSVISVADSKSAKERAEESQFDLVMVDLRLANENGSELIRTLRNTQFVAPILAVSADDEGELESAALAAGANHFLAKPFTAAQLTTTVRELMGFNPDADSTPIFSQFNDDPEMRPLLTEFTRGMAANIDRLREAIARHDFEAIDAISHTLKGAGSGYGFAMISELADDVLNALNDSNVDISRIKHTANDLLVTLNRVKLR